MKSVSCMNLSITCVVLLSLFTTIKSDDASNYYAKYYRDYYNGIAGRLLTLFSGKGTARQSSGYSAPAATYNEPEPTYSEPEYQADTYDPSYDVSEMFGPETGSILGIASLLLGVINLIAFISMDSRVTSLENDQNSICASAKTMGNFNLAQAVGTSATTNAASLNLIVTALNGIATPTC